MIAKETPDCIDRTICARSQVKWKYFAIGVIAIVVVSATFIVCLGPKCSIRRLFASAGLAELPTSAEDVIIERKGGIFEWRFIYVRFKAPKDDISRFVDESAVTPVDYYTAPALAEFRVKGVTDPQWWPQHSWNNHEVYGVTSGGPFSCVWVNSKRYYGALIVDRETNTTYLRFMGPSRLFRLRRSLPF